MMFLYIFLTPNTFAHKGLTNTVLLWNIGFSSVFGNCTVGILCKRYVFPVLGVLHLTIDLRTCFVAGGLWHFVKFLSYSQCLAIKSDSNNDSLNSYTSYLETVKRRILAHNALQIGMCDIRIAQWLTNWNVWHKDQIKILSYRFAFE